MLVIRAGKLLMGNNGFAHRTWYGSLYHGQTLGHFDRSIRTSSAIRNKLGSVATELAADPPDCPMGMQKNTYRRYLKKHAKTCYSKDGIRLGLVLL